ncbi:AN1-type zinc finger protein 4-like [Pholidichthys leucotaenia]
MAKAERVESMLEPTVDVSSPRERVFQAMAESKDEEELWQATAARPCRIITSTATHGKRPELISKREARNITKITNQAYKEPVGSLKHSELLASFSTRAPDSSSTRDGLEESTPTCHLPPAKAPTGIKKKSSNHCFLCGKKTDLATSYECRCGHNFCAFHHYAEAHDCTYDYKSTGRRFLQKTNPLTSAPKLTKI